MANGLSSSGFLLIDVFHHRLVFLLIFQSLSCRLVVGVHPFQLSVVICIGIVSSDGFVFDRLQIYVVAVSATLGLLFF